MSCCWRRLGHALLHMTLGFLHEPKPYTLYNDLVVLSHLSVVSAVCFHGKYFPFPEVQKVFYLRKSQKNGCHSSQVRV